MPSLAVDSGAFNGGTVTDSKATFKEIKVNQEAYNINMGSNA